MSSPVPAELGYFMPAEWAHHKATWITWPKDPLTWPDRLAEVEDIYLRIIVALVPHEIVRVLVDDKETEAAVRQRCTFETGGNLSFVQVNTVDAWIRDYGPNFLVTPDGKLAYNHWDFNAWGNKYEDLKKDNSVPERLERFLGVPRFRPGMVLEGGSIEVNGAGVVMTTEQCLLNRNRNPGVSRGAIEQRLKDYLGVTEVLWLGEGIAGDDTDGHIDDIARFVSPESILCVVEEDPADENYRPLQENLRRLRQARNRNGRHYKITTLPMPGYVAGPGRRLPASYANFYIANGIILLPVFNHPNDTPALDAVQRMFRDRRVVPINCEPLVWGMGTIHCLTQQQPETSEAVSGL